MINNFKFGLEIYKTKNIEVLISRPETKNQNDMKRILSRIFTENNIKSYKNIFVFSASANPTTTKTIINSIPNTMFWDNNGNYYYFMT
ncbi:hypothetical protein DRF69_11050 [Chryseobacterium sp. 5_R23647]|nr:hypothetical protein DRF69_11050 [Chryseobacterium sp. 5_R23647]